MLKIILRTITLLLPCGLLTFVCSCGSPNAQSNFNPDTGRHISNWFPSGHKAAASTAAATCTECHGADFLGGISKVSCRTCHINLTPGSFSCAECHLSPPASGAHSAHSFPGPACFSCHFNTVGTGLHDNGTADIILSTIFNAKSGGTLTFNSGAHTCSSISCHGGQATPNWTSGTLDVNTACTSCHAFGTSQYNSFNSGQHDLHVNQQLLACTECHDTSLLAAGHFTSLNTPAMEGPAARTIKTSIQYNGTTCANPCHGPENWR